jgi:tRNA 2-thiouridine synthesizing protein E
MTPSRVVTLGGKPVHVDQEGFLTNYDEWDEDLARVLAAQLDLELTEDHLRLIRFLRDDYQQRGQTATPRRVQACGGVPIKRQFELFPDRPGRNMAYVAGLPMPQGCL